MPYLLRLTAVIQTHSWKWHYCQCFHLGPCIMVCLVMHTGLPGWQDTFGWTEMKACSTIQIILRTSRQSRICMSESVCWNSESKSFLNPVALLLLTVVDQQGNQPKGPQWVKPWFIMSALFYWELMKTRDTQIIVIHWMRNQHHLTPISTEEVRFLIGSCHHEYKRFQSRDQSLPLDDTTRQRHPLPG